MASSCAVHPLVAEEAGAVFGDAVAAHEADGFAHHVGAVAGVPELAAGQRTLAALNRAGRTARADRLRAGEARCVARPAVHEARTSSASFWTRAQELSAAARAAGDAALRRESRSFSLSSGSSSSKTRAAAKPSEALASPVAQTSTRRCSASSLCCRPSS